MLTELRRRFAETSRALSERPAALDEPRVKKLNSTFACIITINLILVALETDTRCDGFNGNMAHEGLTTPCASSSSVLWSALEGACTAAYLLEAILRLKWIGVRYFITTAGLSDLLLASLSVLDGWILFHRPGTTTVKLLRLCRIIRLAWLTEKGRGLVNSTLGLIVNAPILRLYFCGGILVYVFACIQKTLLDIWEGTIPDETLKLFLACLLWSRLLTARSRMLISHLFVRIKILTRDNWNEHLVRPFDNPGLAIPAILFLTIAVFGLLYVLLAIIVENAVKEAQTSRCAAEARISARNAALLRDLAEIFKNIGSRADPVGRLSRQATVNVLYIPAIRRTLAMAGVSPYDVQELFKRMDFDGDNSVDSRAFAGALPHLAGLAKGRTVTDLKVTTARLLGRAQALMRNGETQLRTTEKVLQRANRLERIIGIVPTAMSAKSKASIFADVMAASSLPPREMATARRSTSHVLVAHKRR
ncbi:hypothetical protein FOL47_004639 [Perkinsus chesapeaki]|uniref:Ion transport domain-containing protein n=1 Tax=Perkinsus chesapeaki TaxID=330153 RepID=A0A7J6M1E6_PERCH|nr:hypothetical protein FOL47_004639 [Perkinsus chesapeaki]